MHSLDTQKKKKKKTLPIPTNSPSGGIWICYNIIFIREE